MSKTFSLTSIAAIVASTMFADMTMTKSQNNPCLCLEQGMGLDTAPKCYGPAYNAPAAISVKCGWDFDIFASFIYWHVSQESMETAFVEPVAAATTAAATDGSVAYPSFKYKPGFKVGVGFNTNYDDWTGWVEYTWLHQTTSHTSTGAFSGSPWFANSTVALQPAALAAFTSVHSSWKMNMDMLDAAFSRPFYQGTQLTIAPYAGLRALWLRQTFNLSLNDTVFPTSTLHQFSGNKSHSWSIGPMLGSMGHWMLGAGFRFEGKAGGSILYTRYTKVSNKQQFLTSATAMTSSHSRLHNYNVLRPTADLGVGMGWGSYFDNQSYYFDLSARYDFNVLWDQNVMARFINDFKAIQGTTGNLYLHGLTVTARFDF